MANDKRTHILVVSDPPVAPGYLPRLRYICDYLDRKGFAVTLLTETSEPLPFAHNYPIETIRMYSGNTFDWFVKTVWTLLTDWHNRVFAKRALTVLHGGFDLVLCTAFSDFPLGAAQRIAQTLQVPLICDIRDLDEQVEDSKYQYQHQQWWLMPFRRLYRAVHIRRRNKVLRSANTITTVSPWHKEFIQNLTANSVPVYTIYNGFDEQQFYPENIRTEQFTITYIGSLFHWQRPALEKVKQAVEEIRSQVSDFRFQNSDFRFQIAGSARPFGRCYPTQRNHARPHFAEHTWHVDHQVLRGTRLRQTDPLRAFRPRGVSRTDGIYQRRNSNRRYRGYQSFHLAALPLMGAERLHRPTDTASRRVQPRGTNRTNGTNTTIDYKQIKR